ncbi:VOC family protein [Erysipelothrix piscisicarius]|uniref:VOC family protein n=1 Tax=Erysipelothrix piscisicarius TaxID=2485784 RepID=UPI002F928659
MKTLKNISIKNVILKVLDLEAMKSFYENTLGLTLLSQNQNTVILGIDDVPLVTLKASESYEKPNKNYSGLYHMAFLLPDESHLGPFLKHLISVNQSITGLGDHLYSQAIYLNDPEGNGIEVYADRPRSSWIIHDDGSIVGGTEPVDVDRLMRIADPKAWDGMPLGTILGHVHVQVADIEKARMFYINQLGFDLKTEMQKALFVSRDEYHHHIGINEWAGPHIGDLPHNITGMESFTISTSSFTEYRNELIQAGETIRDLDENHFKVMDPFHINIIFEKI